MWTCVFLLLTVCSSWQGPYLTCFARDAERSFTSNCPSCFSVSSSFFLSFSCQAAGYWYGKIMFNWLQQNVLYCCLAYWHSGIANTRQSCHLSLHFYCDVSWKKFETFRSYCSVRQQVCVFVRQQHSAWLFKINVDFSFFDVWSAEETF